MSTTVRTLPMSAVIVGDRVHAHGEWHAVASTTVTRDGRVRLTFTGGRPRHGLTLTDLTDRPGVPVRVRPDVTR